MGTSLFARGLSAGVLPEDWLVERPEEIAAVHAAHVAAGARVVLTCTFNLASPRSAGGAPVVVDRARRAVALARRSGAERVAGAVGPIAAPEADVARWYAPAFEALAAAGADLLWAESQWVAEEARGALAAARACRLPAVVTLAFASGEPARLPGGEPVEDVLRALADLGAAAVGVNCVAPGPALQRLVARVAPRLAVPLVVKPSPGLPGTLLPPASFAARVAPLAALGAAWIGGCCGAGEAHLRALGEALGRGP
jgi:5-methyltetrahydrofolate--homocysteine methyltransferase